jgi:hypothetical protein
VAPFLALASIPSDRTFINAFAQVDVPVNQSDWTYREIDIDQRFNPALEAPFTQYDRTLSGKIEDQVLLNLDLGAGFWVYQNPNAKLVNGLAVLGEIHYTTTMDDADIVVVDAIQNRARNVVRNAPADMGGVPIEFERILPDQIAVENQPRLGNTAGRVDILNATFGTVVQIQDKATLAAGYITPLRDDETDRYFDGELTIQLNIYR